MSQPSLSPTPYPPGPRAKKSQESPADRTRDEWLCRRLKPTPNLQNDAHPAVRCAPRWARLTRAYGAGVWAGPVSLKSWRQSEELFSRSCYLLQLRRHLLDERRFIVHRFRNSWEPPTPPACSLSTRYSREFRRPSWARNRCRVPARRACACSKDASEGPPDRAEAAPR